VFSSNSVRQLVTLSGSTITLNCQPPPTSYSGYFVWRFFGYGSVAGLQIYSLPPFTLNTDQFPASRYRQVDDYGLEISGVDWKDGGIYQCEFLTVTQQHLYSVIVIGQLHYSSFLPRSNATTSWPLPTARCPEICYTRFHVTMP